MPSTLGRILITGATGRLGRSLFEHFSLCGAEVIGTFGKHYEPGLEHLDLASESSLPSLLERTKPDVILHTAAMTDVDACEKDESLAMRINAKASEIIAHYAECHTARYVYVSTDYVFDGESGPYREDSLPSPISVYGRSKLRGELPALAYRHGAVARVAILYGCTNPGTEPTLVSQVLAGLGQGKEVRLDGRRIKYPTLTDDVARALESVIERRQTGVFHLGNPSGISRYEWGLAVAAAFDLDPRGIVRDDTVELGKPARRPVNVELLDTRLGFVHTPLPAGLAGIRQRLLEARAA